MFGIMKALTCVKEGRVTRVLCARPCSVLTHDQVLIMKPQVMLNR